MKNDQCKVSVVPINADKGYASVLVIYDIQSDKNRNALHKFLKSYGFTVQKSAFEADLKLNKLEQLISQLPAFIHDEDSIRLYQLSYSSKVVMFYKSKAKQSYTESEGIILI